MRLSPAAELAVRGVLVLAEHHGKGPVPLATVCTPRKLPKQYLTKLFASLAKANLVLPIRGKGGGYVLARDPRRITLLEIIEAVEGPLAMNYCQYDPPRCDNTSCKVRSAWGDIQAYVGRKLGSLTVADCVVAAGREKAGDNPGAA